ncbi:MAG: diaminopimelate decarboxylase [Propionibacteriaceae bacterium]|jgi:diaminopimelate decarboxylase|nr:diaminopimelate decarboxylase [Propionibacteriaceae bacterium]
MFHTHIAGATHADVNLASPQWLVLPDDVNGLDPKLWPSGVSRGADGALTVAGHNLTDVVSQWGTVLYLLDEADFRRRAQAFTQAFAGWQVSYAGKALLSRGLARWVAEENLGLDVCSGGELTVALAAGFPPERISFHGNNKSLAEIRQAIAGGVGRIIVDSLDEIHRLETVAEELETTVRVLVRVTTGVEAHTHDYIATAHEDQKFGFSIASGQALVALVRCFASDWLQLAGVHSHIGSQIFDMAGFEVATGRAMRLMAQFREATGHQLAELNLGGGFGIAYTPADQPLSIAASADSLRQIVEQASRAFDLTDVQLAIEPGRAIVGPASLAVYEVGTVKPVELDGGAQRLYISVDGGMSDNIRPALYAAEYSAVLANRASEAPAVLCRVVGKHCESGDILVRDVFLPGDIRPGDLIAVPAAVAYARSMASNYNWLPRPPVVAVTTEGTYPLLRRETLDDMLALDAG